MCVYKFQGPNIYLCVSNTIVLMRIYHISVDMCNLDVIILRIEVLSYAGSRHNIWKHLQISILVSNNYSKQISSLILSIILVMVMVMVVIVVIVVVIVNKYLII